jgi:hypothetical protein
MLGVVLCPLEYSGCPAQGREESGEGAGGGPDMTYCAPKGTCVYRHPHVKNQVLMAAVGCKSDHHIEGRNLWRCFSGVRGGVAVGRVRECLEWMYRRWGWVT